MDSLLLIKSLCFLVFVLLLAYGLFLIVKKQLHGQGHNNQHIKVLSYRQVDQKLSVSLVLVEGQKMFIATVPGAVAVSQIDSKNGSEGE